MTKEEQLDWLRRLRSDISYMDFSIDVEVSLERKRQYRQVLSEVINALEQEGHTQPEPSQVARDIATIIENEKDMRVIASAQPERKKGKWITNFYAFGEDRYECDQCRNTALHLYDFCPNCGSDMRGEQE